MDELFENDDRLKQLFQEEGRLTTSPGFTERVMERVEMVHSPTTVYQPLISKSMWRMIAAAIAVLVTGCWLASGSYDQAEPRFKNIADPVAGFIRSIDFRPGIGVDSLILITLFVGSISLLLLIDYLLNNKLKGLSKG